MARERDDDVDDRDDDDRPRRRSGGGGNSELTGLDKFFANTPVAIILAIVFFCFCSLAGVILGGIGVFTCKNPDSKRNATIMLVLGVVKLLIEIGLVATGNVPKN